MMMIKKRPWYFALGPYLFLFVLFISWGLIISSTVESEYRDRLLEANEQIKVLQEKVLRLEEENSNLKDELYYTVVEEVEEPQQETFKAEVTAYAPLDPAAVEGVCYSGNPNVTATGTQSRPGVIAADLERIPAGTRLYIPGYGEGVVEDSGGAMRGAEGIALDVFMATRTEALTWGRQNLEITVLEWGS